MSGDALTPSPDGTLRGARAVPVAFSTPRLHGTIEAGWRVDGIGVWGSGIAGSVVVEGAPEVRELVAWPGGCAQSGAGRTLRVDALRDAPALLLDLTSDAPARLKLLPARRAGPPHPAAPPPPTGPTTWRRVGDALAVELPWAALVAWAPGAAPDGHALLLPARARAVVSAGRDLDEALRALEAVRGAPDPLAATERHRARCASRLATPDPLLGSLMAHALHVVLAARKEDARGRFAGLSAGIGYAYPARTYFRDGYWTCQPLLAFAPSIVREQLLLLAGGVHADGEAPSGIVVGADGEAAGDSWADHFDSPLFLPILADQYLAVTGDAGVLDDRGGLLRAALRRVEERYLRLAAEGAGLPRKPRNDRDWADNVFREGAVAYDVMLWLGALRALGRLAGDDAARARLAAVGEAGARVLDAELWLPGRGHHADFRAADGFVEEHLAIDVVTGVYLRVLPEDRAAATLDAIRRLLFTRDDASQPWGDWGVRCCRPAYARASDVRAKSAFAFRYHNGSDWPYWDAVDAACRLRAGRPESEWRYPLLRWWEYGLAQGWSSPVEYYAPPYPRGALLQAWSGMAAAAIAMGSGWSPFGDHRPRPSPFGEARLALGGF